MNIRILGAALAATAALGMAACEKQGPLEKAGEGPRERQSAASRVFRVWRSDEAERRIRDIALRGYESGIEKSTKTPV